MSEDEKQIAQMLFFSLWSDAGGHESFEAGLQALRLELATRDELRTIVDIAFDAARHQTIELAGRLHRLPLRIHARYQPEEILAGLGYASMDEKPNAFR